MVFRMDDGTRSPIAGFCLYFIFYGDKNPAWTVATRNLLDFGQIPINAS